MFTTHELSMNPKREVITEIKGKKQVWDIRDEAEDFFLREMCMADNSDYDRLAGIYIQIIHGLSYCTDNSVNT